MAAEAARSVSFKPAGALHGVALTPPDKSISHRAMMIAAICAEQVDILYFLEADDTLATLRAIEACGVEVDHKEPGHYVVHGMGLRGLSSPGSVVDVGNSGTSMRLLPGIFAGQKGEFILDGDKSIRSRPMDRIVKPLREMEIAIEAREGKFAPLKVTGGPVKAITYELPVASAQVKSAILFAGLYANGPTKVIEPTICRDHTERMLVQAGARVEKNHLATTIWPADKLRLDEVIVPGDFSSAAFFIVAATLVPDSEIALTRVGVNETRTGLLDIMRKMGADLEVKNIVNVSGEPYADIHVSSADLHGVDIDGDISGRAIDELPLVALLGAFAEGETVVSGAAELRVKESDRIGGLVANLSAVGVDIETTEDGFVVRGGSGVAGGSFKSMGDHRMAMLGAIAGLASEKGVDVIGFGCVAVSFPDFEKTLSGLLGGSS